MLDDEPANDEAELVFTVRLAPAGAVELGRLANDVGKNIVALATEHLEVEVEAEHGPRCGPWLRTYIHR